MAFVNFSTREVTAKIVYYGPGLCGKTTSLQYIYDSVIQEHKGQMVSLATDVDRTIYFDFLPVKLGKIQEFTVRIQLYTVPGQVRYNSTRKLVLNGADGVVFVADSQRQLEKEDVRSFKNLQENLRSYGRALKDIPHILQFNKRDLPDLLGVDYMNRLLNKHQAPFFETCATTGEGILEGLKAVARLVMQDLNRKGIIQRGSANYGAAGRLPDTASRPMVGEAGARNGKDEGNLDASAERDSQSPAQEAEGPAQPSPVPRRVGPEEDTQVVSFNPHARSNPSQDGADRGLALEEFETASPLAGRTYLPFSEAVHDEELSGCMREAESALINGKHAEALKSAMVVMHRLMEDSDLLPQGASQSEKLFILQIPWKRFHRLDRILKKSDPTRLDVLYALHFVTEVYFSRVFF